MSSSFKDLLKCKTLWAAIVCTAIYWAAGAILPTQSWLETVRIAQATFALVALVALSRAFWYAITRRHPDRVDVLTIATSLKEFAFLWTGLWLLLYRLAGNDSGHKPEWMLDVLSFGFFAGWIPALSSILLVAVPGVLRRDEATGEDIPPAMLIASGAIAGFGLFLALVVLAIRPDAHSLVEAIRPWVR